MSEYMRKYTWLELAVYWLLLVMPVPVPAQETGSEYLIPEDSVFDPNTEYGPFWSTNRVSTIFSDHTDTIEQDVTFGPFWGSNRIGVIFSDHADTIAQDITFGPFWGNNRIGISFSDTTDEISEDIDFGPFWGNNRVSLTFSDVTDTITEDLEFGPFWGNNRVSLTFSDVTDTITEDLEFGPFWGSNRISFKFQDQLPPETDILRPVSGTIIYNPKYRFEWIGNDDTTPTVDLQYSYRLDDQNWSDFSLNTSTNSNDLTEGEHTFEVKAKDLDNKEDPTPAIVDFNIDLSAPIITNIEINPLQTNCTITFSTDEPSKALIQYGIDSNTNLLISSTNEWKTEHTITISGLEMVTAYTYTIEIWDQGNHRNITQEGIFETKGAPDLVVTGVMFDTDMVWQEGTLSLEWTILNQGVETAGGERLDAICLSNDKNIGEDVLIAEVSQVDSIAPGETKTFSSNINISNDELNDGIYFLVVTTDVSNKIFEGGNESNNSFINSNYIILREYEAIITRCDVDIAPAGSPVTLHGEALRLSDGELAPNVPVQVAISVRGISRVSETITDTNGEFELVFTPLSMEAGRYQAFAKHPFDLNKNESEVEFSLVGMKASPNQVQYNLITGIPLSATLELSNLGDVPLQNIQKEIRATSNGISLDIQFPAELNGLEITSIPFVIEAMDDVTENSTINISLTSIEGATELVEIETHVTPSQPKLVNYPGVLNIGMIRGSQKFVECELTNSGGAPAENVRIELPQSNLQDWLKLASPDTFSMIEPGETKKIIVALRPPDDMILGPYQGEIIVHYDLNKWIQIPFNFISVSDSKGDLRVNVVDEYTVFGESAPRVIDATVTLMNPADSTTILATSNSNGTALIEDVTEAFYYIDVEADRHYSITRLPLELSAGIVNEATVFLNRELITYRFNVEPAEIEDKYNISIETVFETNVLAPVVTIDPPIGRIILFDDQPTTINFNITNHGLIDAENTYLNFPVDSYFTVTPLVEDIGVIPAGQTITVPVRVEKSHETSLNLASQKRLSSIDRIDEDIFDKGPCEKSISGKVVYDYVCVGTTWVEIPIPIYVFEMLEEIIKAGICTADLTICVGALSTPGSQFVALPFCIRGTECLCKYMSAMTQEYSCCWCHIIGLSTIVNGKKTKINGWEEDLSHPTTDPGEKALDFIKVTEAVECINDAINKNPPTPSQKEKEREKGNRINRSGSRIGSGGSVYYSNTYFRQSYVQGPHNGKGGYVWQSKCGPKPKSTDSQN